VKKPAPAPVTDDGRGWFRTSDLSRVKRTNRAKRAKASRSETKNPPLKTGNPLDSGNRPPALFHIRVFGLGSEARL